MELPSGTVQVAGWGKTENTTHSDVLLKVQVDMMMAKECKLNFPSFNFIADDDTQICAGGQEGKCRNKKTQSIIIKSYFKSLTQMFYSSLIHIFGAKY